MNTKQITIIGLGQMGTRLAELLVTKGYNVSVWNRTRAKADGIAGVKVFETLEEAIRQSPLVVICVLDYEAVNRILDGISDKSVLAGKTLINFTTADPQEAEGLEAALANVNAGYINGAIQVAPDQMGLPETTIIVSGNQAHFERSRDALAVFGGNIKYLGDRAALASAMDLATLTWLYGSYTGLIHGIVLSQKSGLSLSAYGEILGEITPGFTEFFKHQIGVVEKGDFTISQSPLSISVAATQRIHHAFRNAGAQEGFVKSISDLLQKAESLGLADQELASLVKVVE
ncbi:3-hydroxyisobutyrate dehydrogenase [Dyadobacter sp. SG02]|uniref:NAD(P)-dependent oxidoreductase n=1 Tax=Dyadobacter sp. SG02 TaxID=1855291 RepID=UPI0008B345AC|nr:NAD(P)-binding domain-containing protein [Dyadobacter sp. SG02]SEI38700.1 3-hydroxyisobutyrate dehydrogenase [Dyadobacter sp. SG02]